MTIPIFIGYDPRERVAANVLIDSLNQRSSKPLATTLIHTPQLEDVFHRAKDPKQSTAFSFTRFLVPYLTGYQGWAIFMDCDMLCRGDIAELWALRDERYAVMCVQHNHVPREATKFLGEVQTAYPKKNWSSLMLMNCARCRALTPEYVNTASGLELHRFLWLGDDALIGAVPDRWNYLLGVQDVAAAETATPEPEPTLVHWTLGGPWFRAQRHAGGKLASEWFGAREDAMKLWD
jgi:lipopolysaccharide biosynthesis glycosyltransferase